MNKHFEYIVIGGGSAGYNSAREALQYTDSVAVIDGANDLGGLCILKGCMPSKTLLYSADVLHHAKNGATFGLDIPSATANMRAIAERKKRIIGEFADFRLKQLKSGKFELIRSQARFVSPTEIELSDGSRLTASKFLIATGSKVSTPPIPGLAEAEPWTSDDVLDLDFIPENVIVLGGGIVAVELSQFLNRIGSKVTLIQRSSHILSQHSADAATVVEQALRDEGIQLYTDTKLKQVSFDGCEFSATFDHRGSELSLQALHLFNALGRSPNTSNLNLSIAGIEINSNGQIQTDEYQQTTNSLVYAAGDCCGPHEIVHIAIQQGETAARHAFDQDTTPVDDNLLLGVVFTDPQLATIGLTENDLQKSDIPYIAASYPFDDHGKSILMEAKYGHVKVLADPQYGRILGAEIVGKDAGELIHIFSVAMAMNANVADLLRAPWYHPTLAEIITYPLEEIADQIFS
jgi:pyruvate/2-oxoglutarate dehydrogenase complex dihydrolipoamide dehydrogenase (E3) component